MPKGIASAPRSSAAASGLELLNYRQAAEYLGPAFTVRQVRREVHEYQRIKAVRLGPKRHVIARAELDAFIERLKAGED